jgi:preprotein translocase subunit YajC
MKHKSIAVALITFLICMVLGSSIACTTPATEYVLNISSTEGGSVTEPGVGKFPYCQEQGERVNLVATPDAGYRFVNWTGDVDTIADVDDPTTTITVNDDYSITANFAKVYDLTTSSTAGGSVSTPGEGTFTYDEGKVVDLVATPDAGYRFVNWTGDVGTIADIYDPTTAIKMNDDYSVIAKFKAIPEGEHSLTISSTAGGSVTTPGEGTFIYSEGDEVNLVATPDAGYQFVNWTGDVDTIIDIDDAATTMTINDDYSITANFEEIVEYELTISSIEGGSVTIPGEGTFIYSEGDEVNLVATPDAGYRFVNWTGDVGTIADVNAAVTTITMNGDYDITANFLDP